MCGCADEARTPTYAGHLPAVDLFSVKSIILIEVWGPGKGYIVKSLAARLRGATLFVAFAILTAIAPYSTDREAFSGELLSAFHSDVSISTKDHQVAALLDKAQQGGTVRVIVTLNMPFKPEGALQTPASILAQRNGIAKAQEAISQSLDSPNSIVLWNFKHAPLMVIKVDAAGMTELASDPKVSWIEEDRPSPPTLSQSVPLVGGDQAWLAGYTGAGQAVAILDTGVDSSHEFLTGKVVSEACFSSNYGGSTTLCPNGLEEQTGAGAGVNCPLSVDGCDHGTHVAGIAAGDGASFSGVAKGADIIFGGCQRCRHYRSSGILSL
jgi:subtilisin family serine protease